MKSQIRRDKIQIRTDSEETVTDLQSGFPLWRAGLLYLGANPEYFFEKAQFLDFMDIKGYKDKAVFQRIFIERDLGNN